MAAIGNQTIKTLLAGDSQVESPTHVRPNYFVPPHVHSHGGLEGLTSDSHPQYLTDQRGYDLFISLIPQISDHTTAKNIGSGYGLFKQKNGHDLEFLGLIAGDNIVISLDSNDNVVISAAPPGATVSTELQDFDLTGIAIGDSLVWDGVNFIPVVIGTPLNLDGGGF